MSVFDRFSSVSEQTFSVRHTLSFSNRGLVIARNNGIRDNIIHLARQ